MTKKQKVFYDYLQKLKTEEREDTSGELEQELNYQKQARSIAENAVVDLTKENKNLKGQIVAGDVLEDEMAKKIKELEEQLEIEHSGLIGSYRYVKYDYGSMEQAFLAGLKAGRPKWHKVADGDLPKEDDVYLVYTTRGVLLGHYEQGGADGETEFTGEPYSDFTEYPSEMFFTEDEIIAWCEIPTFTDRK